MYTKIETAMKMINMPKHPMANSLLIWLMEYLMNSKNMESHLDIGCLKVNYLYIVCKHNTKKGNNNCISKLPPSIEFWRVIPNTVSYTHLTLPTILLV